MYATVQELVDALTPEEKAGLCTGAAVPRLGLPALRVSGLHSQESAGGVCFPSACAAAASFDPEAARRMGAALGLLTGLQLLAGEAPVRRPAARALPLEEGDRLEAADRAGPLDDQRQRRGLDAAGGQARAFVEAR